MAQVTRQQLEQIYDEAKSILVDFEGVGLNLRGYDLTEIDLNQFDFQCADLEGARFDCSNLCGAYFGEANLKNASFIDANLEGADLNHANLDRANFTGANLKDADIRGASLQGTQITQQQRSSAKKDTSTDIFLGYGIILVCILLCAFCIALSWMVFSRL